MTADEVDVLFSDLFGFFPDVNDFVLRSPNPAKTLEGWRLCLQALDYEVCDAVLKRMVTGEIEPPKAYERQRMAHHIRLHAYRLLDRQRELADVAARREERARLSERDVVQQRTSASICADIIKLWERAKTMFPDYHTQKSWVQQHTEDLFA